jgi:hypothetical protein
LVVNHCPFQTSPFVCHPRLHPPQQEWPYFNRGYLKYSQLTDSLTFGT